MALVVVGLTCLSHTLAAQAAQQAATSSIAGRVINGVTGAPLARVLVEANGAFTFTDHEGKFGFAEAGGVSTLVLTKPGFAGSPEQMDSPGFLVPKSADPLNLEFSLWPEAILAGTVTGPEGQALARLNVVARRTLYENGVRRSQPTSFTATNSRGNFRLPVPAGDYVLETRYGPPGSSDADSVLPTELPSHSSEATGGSIHIVSGQELHFDLHPAVAPAHKFTLPVDTASERQVPSITLRTSDGVLYQPGAMRMSPRGVTMELPAGTYELFAQMFEPDGLRTGQALVNVPDRDATGNLLHLEPLPAIPVEVAIDPADLNLQGSSHGSSTTPNPGAFNLQLDPVDGSEDLGGGGVRLASRGSGVSTFSAPPGLYRLSGGEGSGWVIESATFGGTDLLRDNLAIGPNGGAEPIRLLVSSRGGTISGVTRLHGAAAACWVVLVGNGAALPRFQMRRSDADGRLNLSGVAPGTYRALAMPFMHSANFADPAVLDAFRTYVQEITVDASTSATLSLDAVPAEELFR